MFYIQMSDACRRSELYLYRQSVNCCFMHYVATQSLVKGQTSFLGCKRWVFFINCKSYRRQRDKNQHWTGPSKITGILTNWLIDTSIGFAYVKENFWLLTHGNGLKYSRSIYLEGKYKTNLRGIVVLFGNFIKSQKVSSHQLNSKTNDLVLLLKTIWRNWNCFLKLFRYGWHGWKWIEIWKNWPILYFFSSFDATCSKSPQEICYR